MFNQPTHILAQSESKFIAKSDQSVGTILFTRGLQSQCATLTQSLALLILLIPFALHQLPRPSLVL